MAYELGVDLGTTYTAAAIHRSGRTQIVELGNRGATIPSVIFLTEEGTILTGEAANRRAATSPGRVAREFKRRIGDPTPLLLGGSPYSAESLSARLLEWVIGQVTSNEGEAPARVAVTHPANWGPYKLDLLHQAFRMANLDQVVTLSEPEAAAIHYATLERIDPGMTVAVFDLGGGTFDAAILRKKANGFDFLGQPEGIERLGGIDFDAAVFAFVRNAVGNAIDDLDASDPAVLAAVARLRRDCVDAKEALSSDTEVGVPVVLPGLHTDIRLTRVEFEQMIRPSLVDSIGAMQRAIRSADLALDEIDLVLLVGGSSRIPLVGQMVGGELGRPIAVDAHPKHSVALGAARAAADSAGAHLAEVTSLHDPVSGQGPAGAAALGGAGLAGAAGAPVSAEAPSFDPHSYEPPAPSTPVGYQAPAAPPVSDRPSNETPATTPATRASDPSPYETPATTPATRASDPPSYQAPAAAPLSFPPAGGHLGADPSSGPSGPAPSTHAAGFSADGGSVGGVIDPRSGSPLTNEVQLGSGARRPDSGSRRTLLVVLGAAALVLVIVAVAASRLLGGGDGDDLAGQGLSEVGEGGAATDDETADGTDDETADDGTDDGADDTADTADGDGSATTEASTATTEAETTTTAFTCNGLCAHIDRWEEEDDGELLIYWEPFNYEPDVGNFHAHFYFDIYEAEQVGTNAAKYGVETGAWQLTDEIPFSTRGSGVAIANAPAGATQLCVVAADSGHGVINPENHECFDLP
ncbi:MAG: Hsp70 family protein [Acidimicrobiales bacterium]